MVWLLMYIATEILAAVLQAQLHENLPVEIPRVHMCEEGLHMRFDFGEQEKRELVTYNGPEG